MLCYTLQSLTDRVAEVYFTTVLQNSMLLLVIAVFLALQVAWVRFISKGVRNVGPLPLFLVGNLPLVLLFGTKLEKFVDYLRRKHGNMFEFWMGWKRVIYIGDPKVVKKILTGDTETFEKMPWEKHVLAPVMEGGLIILSGDLWKSHHRTINTFFNSEMYNVMCKEVAEAVKKVWPHGQQMSPIKLQTEFRRLGSEILSKLIFGWSLSDRGSLQQFVDTIELLNHDLEERAKDLLKMRPYIAPNEVATSSRAKLEGEELLLGYISEAREAYVRNYSGSTPTPKFRTLMDIMLSDPEFSDTNIMHEIKTLFGASETTVHLMTWSIHELSQNPAVEAKLLNELELVSGDEPYLTMEQLNKCTYLPAVVNECLRMYPPAPAMFRQAVKDVRLSDHIIADKGSVLAICPFFIHKDPDYWESPNTFMPERFLENSNSSEWHGENVNNPAFIPFGNGKRQCIGKKFSLIEASVMMASLLKQYKYFPRPGQKIEPCTDILNRPRYGIEMVQEFRESNGANQAGHAAL